jgi:hypothetical protein
VKAPVASGFAQTTGEIRHVSAKADVALQQFVPRCVFFATFPALSAITTHLSTPAKKHRACYGYFFSMKAAAIVYRRYMSGIVMLMH